MSNAVFRSAGILRVLARSTIPGFSIPRETNELYSLDESDSGRTDPYTIEMIDFL